MIEIIMTTGLMNKRLREDMTPVFNYLKNVTKRKQVIQFLWLLLVLHAVKISIVVRER